VKAKNRASYEANRAKRNAESRAYYAQNRDQLMVINRERYARNHDRYQATQRAWWEANRERINAGRREFKSRHTYQSWVARLKKRGGLTPEDYWRILDAQGGGCALCGTHDPGKAGGSEERVFAVDHCHATGRVRGLLCHNCNRGLGYFRDHPGVLVKAAEYVRRSYPSSPQERG